MTDYTDRREAAIAWLRSRGRYLLDGAKYTPANGVAPLPAIEQPARLADTSYGGLCYLKRFDDAIEA